MVTSNLKKRKTAEYSLEHLHRLASRRQIHFANRKMSSDIENLGYSLLDVCECLKNLTPENYLESVRYKKSGLWHDVYHCQWSTPQSTATEPDELYIKLGFDEKCTTILVASFHLH